LGSGLAIGTGNAAAPARPFELNLDDWDRSKVTVTLPNGQTLGLIERGPQDGPPLVLIHGYTDSARDWLPLVPSLNPKRHLLIVDIRGHGASSKPDCCYAPIDFAYDIKLLLDAKHIDRADIMGHSLGSIISQVFAEQFPERVRKVILVSSTGGRRADCQVKNTVPSMDFRSSIQQLSDPIDPDSAFMIEWWSSPTPVDEAFIKRQREDAARMPVKVWLAILDQGLDGIDLQATLPKLKAPTLMLWGEKDPIFGAADRCSLMHALPKAPVKIFKGLGHNMFWEDPTGVAKVVDAFLDK
jgi:pimeloyl-ACP methyl ester carboxylesterase